MKIICPTCQSPKPVRRGSPYFPFCSVTCRDRDLGNWVEEKYRVDAGPVAREEEEGMMNRE